MWQEYKAAHSDGWQYSVFCDRYRRWLARQEPVLRQEHAPGDKLFVDYAGQTVAVTDRYNRHVPWINLRGFWLAQAGFSIGTPYTIEVYDGKLVFIVA